MFIYIFSAADRAAEATERLAGIRDSLKQEVCACVCVRMLLYACGNQILDFACSHMSSKHLTSKGNPLAISVSFFVLPLFYPHIFASSTSSLAVVPTPNPCVAQAQGLGLIDEQGQGSYQGRGTRGRGTRGRGARGRGRGGARLVFRHRG